MGLKWRSIYETVVSVAFFVPTPTHVALLKNKNYWSSQLNNWDNSLRRSKWGCWCLKKTLIILPFLRDSQSTILLSHWIPQHEACQPANSTWVSRIPRPTSHLWMSPLATHPPTQKRENTHELSEIITFSFIFKHKWANKSLKTQKQNQFENL